MADLIYRALIEKFIENGLNRKKDPLGYDAIEILTEIHYTPAVDAVPVVRCKDCKHASLNLGVAWCNRTTADNGVVVEMEYDDFCSYGERKEQA